jgi:hypothetical protein
MRYVDVSSPSDTIQRVRSAVGLANNAVKTNQQDALLTLINQLKTVSSNYSEVTL